MSHTDTVTTIASRWRGAGGAFVFYREPGAVCCRGCYARNPEKVDDIGHLAGKKGFVFAPFHSGEGQSIWLLPLEEEIEVLADRIVDGTEKEAPAPVPLVGKLESVPSTGYAHAFSMFSKALREGIFQKLVLSRRAEVPCPAGFSWVEAFRAACRRYVHSYIYLFYAPQTGFWLGATPEILLKGRHGEFETVALAGTQWLKNGKLAERWSEKNVREQGYVADYIGDCLRGQGIPFSEEGPVTVTAGELAHLKTVFRFSISATKVCEVVQALHPTPAVCGLPKNEAFHFIKEHEGYHREYYSGFLGMFDPAGETALYVNLRCMQSVSDGVSFRLYAGGGLLSSSVLEDEWMETERKLQTMKYVIVKGTSNGIY